MWSAARINRPGLKHRFSEKRNKHGHDPGFVYLLALPDDNYKIGKCEYITDTDDFNLDDMNDYLLERLRKRMVELKKHPVYRDAKFVHAIRVACGEGGEKHPFVFYNSRVKIPGASEVFKLSAEDIEIFQECHW